MADPDFSIKQNDTYPPIDFTLTDAQRTISSVSKSGSTVTVTTTKAHKLASGEYVYLYGTTNFSDDVARLITVTSPVTYTYTDADATAKATETTGTSNRAVDLSTATTVKLIARKSDGALTITGTATKDPTQTAKRGNATYTFLAADTGTIGSYDLEFEVNFGGTPAKITTFPNVGYLSMLITDDLG